MFLSLSQLAEEAELGVQVTSLHTLLKLGQGDAFFNFTNVFILGDPLIRQVLRGFWSFNNDVWLASPR